MNTSSDLTLWMTEFLRSTDQHKKLLIQEARSLADAVLLDSIRFHLALRDKLHLLQTSGNEPYSSIHNAQAS
ncbi:hypothetical protein [Paenibacillus protaetiae]|uniref:Uncharacterized protein n=1 Tax=Paenibacillus protaetiae TaxID=2509456 RepID=A0A4P6EZ47_9BACL|nr:hypothetical protein [Paenibacillus protaetiae]QAY65977.1 hypothetical protein ET464_05820 [Paenibacillus protaetiae]